MLTFSKSVFSLKQDNTNTISKNNTLYTKLNWSLSSNSFFPSKPILIKKSNTFYSLHKLFIITTNDKITENITTFKDQTSFNFYYPIKPKNSIQHLLRIAQKYKNLENPSEIICSNLKDICLEICRFAILNTEKHSYKINIYDNNSHPILTDSQLALYPPLSTIYAKVNIINDNNNESIYKKVKNESTSHMYMKNACIKSISQKTIMYPKMLIRSKRGCFGKRWKRIKGNLKLNNNISISNNYSSSINVKSNSVDQETDTNDIDFNINSLSSPTANCNKSNCFYSTSCNSPVVFFNSISNTQHKTTNNSTYKNNKHSKVNKVKIKHLNMNHKDFGCFRRKDINMSQYKCNLISFSPFKMRNKSIEDKIRNNKKLFRILNASINKMISNYIDKYITNGDLNFFEDDMNCHYILIQELVSFPINKVRKEFLGFVFFSNYSNRKYNELNKRFCLQLQTHPLSFDFFFEDAECESFLKDMITLYNTINHEKYYLLENIKEEIFSHKMSISYMIFVLFIILNESNFEYINVDITLNVIHSMNIYYENSLTFQDYCNVNLYLKRVEYLSKYKKFFLLKEIMKEIDSEKNREKRKERKELIEKEFGISEDIWKVLIKCDLITIHKVNNVNVYNVFKEVERIFCNILLYYKVKKM